MSALKNLISVALAPAGLRRPLRRVMQIYLSDSASAPREPIEFHVFDGDKLIIRGAMSALVFGDGLYLDCKPDVAWEDPVLENGVLTITQAYSATMNGTILEVE